jgi:hypothetical protein
VGVREAALTMFASMRHAPGTPAGTWRKSA